ncbi:hypothetical protein [Oricola cellulosilytica]|uniref:hypothetical protein n=1 Tax=Oricola cellulosilytica TaxID=1429082 RepID=UPI001CBADDAF
MATGFADVLAVERLEAAPFAPAGLAAALLVVPPFDGADFDVGLFAAAVLLRAVFAAGLFAAPGLEASAFAAVPFFAGAPLAFPSADLFAAVVVFRAAVGFFALPLVDLGVVVIQASSLKNLAATAGLDAWTSAVAAPGQLNSIRLTYFAAGGDASFFDVNVNV